MTTKNIQEKAIMTPSTLALTVFIISTSILTSKIDATKCNKDNFVYGENEIFDQLMVCSLSKSYDLDLTPRSEYLKSTSRALVEQGLSNKTSIIYAKLNGLWSSKRTKFIDSGWKCESNKTTLTSVVEYTGLSLELIERLELPLHNNQHKLSYHKPCKTFDLPTWMCRASRPIYRTTTTWVNTAYLNVTLSQSTSDEKPVVEKISLLFSCPETFKQKLSHSPSAMYILSKYMHHDVPAYERNQSRNKRDQAAGEGVDKKFVADYTVHHQDSQSLGNPGYHNSVNLILNHLTRSFGNSLKTCISLLDLNLNLVNEYSSFRNDKLNQYYDGKSVPKRGETINNVSNLKCSDHSFISQRIDLANQVEILDDVGETQGGHINQRKRSQYKFDRYPEDPDQLLNPFGYYHENNNIDEYNNNKI